MRTRRGARVLGVLLVVLVAGIPSLADAATESVADPRRDVYVYLWEEDQGTRRDWPVDIARVTVNHTKTRVRVVTKFHALKKGLWDDFFVYVDSDRDPQIDYRFEVDAFYPEVVNGVYRGKKGSTRVCDVTSNVNHAGNSIVLSAPRKCFGTPGTLRVKARFFASWPQNPGSNCCYNLVWDDTRLTPTAKSG